MIKYLLLYSSMWALLMSLQMSQARPQEFQQGVLLAAGQIKDVIDNGAAARNDKSIEFMGAKMKTGFEVGFGDAVKHKRSTEDSDDDDDSSSSSSDSNEDKNNRRKRSTKVDSLINDIKMMYAKH